MLKIEKLMMPLALLALFFIYSCDEDDEDPMANLTLSISGLEDLGSGYAYEGWIMVDGSPQTTGVFTVDGSGNLSKSSFSLDADALDKATAFILTVEPSPDPDPAPTAVHILAGDFSAKSASLSVAHGAALGNSFSNAAGKYILATPTNGDNNDEKSGVWFLNLPGPSAGLTLPTLPTGWVYEGWAVVGGTPLSTGTFTNVAMADDDAPFSGNMDAPPFPGEDFLNNAPSGIVFPVDLSGGKVVISIEPVPDNSPAPFVLKPLAADVSPTAMDHLVYNMSQNLSSFPTGTASK